MKYTLINWVALAAFLVSVALGGGGNDRRMQKPLLIAHRGASGEAPEHTLAAYELAIAQGADFVEQDLQVTKDGVLICLHDPDLGRTTDVAEKYPDRATSRDVSASGKPRRGWFALDFTLAEIKTLDAGSWFNRANPFAAQEAYAGQRVPTFEETVRFVGDRAGLYVELKHFEFYKSNGHDVAAKLAAVLDANGYRSAGRRGRLFIQSFYKTALLRLRQIAPLYPRVQLLPMEDNGRDKDSAKVSPELAREIASYANGAGPPKAMLSSAAEVGELHKAGLTVHPYTFRGVTSAVKRRPLDDSLPDGVTVRAAMQAEIRRFLSFGIDGGFTDYPAVWKQAVEKER